MPSRRFALILALAAALPCALAAQAAPYSSTFWNSMRYRLIGPFRGGRVTAVTGVPSQPNTFYFGSTGGGVWKTTDAGYSWTNVSDGYFAVGSMGAVAVADSDPNVVYAGTGSSKIRSNVSIGRGIYRSSDAGKSWSFIGLRDVGQIAAIRIDPNDPNLVYVAAQGNP
ncbi:MAG: WD40/YVTN/BNR-like repeat-containing protein, partial [Streptosporangiaceae bacterium]